MKLYEVADNRPLVWRLAAQQMEKGKKIGYHAHLPGSSSYIVGRVEKMGGSGATIYNLGGRNKVLAIFTADDDTKLTLRPSNNPDVADYMIVDIE